MHDFTPCELEVMQVLWRRGALKPAEIVAQLDRPLTNAALRSTLRILTEKGHLARKRKGKAYYYRPKKSTPVAMKSMARRLADLFCGGTSFQLIAHLIKTESLSADDLRQLKAIAEQRAANAKSTGGKGDS